MLIKSSLGCTRSHILVCIYVPGVRILGPILPGRVAFRCISLALSLGPSHVHLCAFGHIRMHVRSGLCTYMYMCACICTVYAWICMYMHVYACICIYLHVYACICMHMHVCACICMYMHVLYAYTCMYMHVYALYMHVTYLYACMHLCILGIYAAMHLCIHASMQQPTHPTPTGGGAGHTGPGEGGVPGILEHIYIYIYIFLLIFVLVVFFPAPKLVTF